MFYPFGPKQEKDTTKQIRQLKSQLPKGLLPKVEAECGKPQDGMVPRPRDGGCEAWRIGRRRRWLLEQERVLHFEDHLAAAVTFRSWFSQPTEIQGGTGREKCPKAHPPLPLTSSSCSPLAMLSKNKWARNLWVKARDQQFFSIMGQIVDATGFWGQRISLSSVVSG